MDYKKKYKKALEELKQCVKFDIEPAKTILRLFPELEESDYVIKQRLKHLLGYFRSRGIDHDLCDRILKWLEKQSEQNPAWSEEDEDAIGLAIEALEDLCDEDCPNDSFIGHNLSFYEAAKRLKVLKPQPHWKPTEQQMNALKQTSENYYVMYNTILKSLYNDLKKL